MLRLLAWTAFRLSFSIFLVVVVVASHEDGRSSDNVRNNLYEFGFSLFSSVASHQTGGNVLVSPLSAAQSLSLVAAGATPSSKCEAQLLSVLGVESHKDVPDLVEEILGSTTGGEEDSYDDGVKLTTAVGVWSKGIKQSYVDLAKEVHSAEAKDLPETYGPVNEWIEEATEGVITDLFDGSESIDSFVRALLVSAVHFKGVWTQRFDQNKTTDGIFHVSGGLSGAEEITERPARFMSAQRDMLVTESADHLGGATVLRLDYGEAKEEMGGIPQPRDFCALLVLPAAPTTESMSQVIEGLRSTPISKTLGGLFSREVKLSIPRFRVEWGTSSLKKALRSMGVGDAFHGTDSFLALSDDEQLYLEDVLHKAVLEVTEEGTVAAAATASVMRARSMPPPLLDLNFDRPFVMAILHIPTGTPLFLAKLAEPDLLSDSFQ